MKLTVARYMTLAKSAQAHLEGEEVVGKFAESEPLVVKDVVRICETYANCPDTAERIVAFTKQFAPVHVAAQRAKEFRFELAEWRYWHNAFLAQWKFMASGKGSFSQGATNTVGLGKGNYLEFGGKGAAFWTETFNQLIALCFAAIPRERLRVCPSPDCRKPYFVAHHLKQTFCGSQFCIAWGKRKLKLEYWNQNKEQLLAKRKQKRKGASNGTKKAR